MKHPLIFTLLTTALLMTACSVKEAGPVDNDTEARTVIRGILNGWEADNDTFRMVGSLVRTTSLLNMRTAGYSICTGTLIAKNVVMTAAHCVVKADGSTHPVNQLFFTNRDNVLEANLNKFREVTSVRVVKGYNAGTLDSPDIAIIRLKANLKTEKVVIDGDGVAASSNPTFAVGYGLSGTSLTTPASVQDTGAGIRRFGVLKISEREDLVSQDGSLTAYGKLITNDFGGSTIYQQVCHGDSGGPLFANVAGEFRVVGVAATLTALLPGQCSQVIESSFIATAPFASWIKEKKEELSSEGGCRGLDGTDFVTADGGCRLVQADLVFSRESNVRKNFNGAKRYCDELEQGGKSDWRLPTEAELKALPLGSIEKLALDGSTVGYQFWTNVARVRVYIGEGANHGKSYTDGQIADRNAICVRR